MLAGRWAVNLHILFCGMYKHTCPLTALGDPLTCAPSGDVSGTQGHHAQLHRLGTVQPNRGTFADLDMTDILPRVRRCTACTVMPGRRGQCGTAVFGSKGVSLRDGNVCEKQDSFLCF